MNERIVLVCIALAIGCAESPEAVSVDSQSGARLARSIATAQGEIVRFPPLDSVREIRLDLAAHDLGPEMDDEALIAAVTKTNGRVIIGLKPLGARKTRESGIVPAMSATAVLAARSLLAQENVSLARTYRFSSEVVADIPPSLAPELRRLQFVNFIDPDYLAVPGQSSQDTAWGLKKVEAQLAWPRVAPGTFSTVTIIDTGLDSTHALNTGKDGPAALTNCLYVAPTTSSCWSSTTDPHVIHGSRVAGIISARDNDAGYIGIAFEPWAFNSINVCNGTGCPWDAVMAALDWAIGSGYSRHIVNISIQGCEGSTALASKIAAAANAGILVVSIAGNTTRDCSGYTAGITGVTFPGRYPEVIAVSGTMTADQFADPGISPCTGGSRYGPEVDLAAPFEAISMTANGGWASGCGTSFAAPVVTGVAALVWTANTDWTASQVRSRLLSTALDLGPTGFDNKFGYGRVSASHAIPAPAPPPSPSVRISGNSEIAANVSCQWYASASGGSPPYSYAWTANGSPVGNDSDALSYRNNGSPFTLAVTITDQDGGTDSDEFDVDIVSGAYCT